MRCPVCATDLEVAIVLHEAGGVPELVATVVVDAESELNREAWQDAEQAALLREAERGEAGDI
jgi:hypothetical protein